MHSKKFKKLKKRFLIDVSQFVGWPRDHLCLCAILPLSRFQCIGRFQGQFDLLEYFKILFLSKTGLGAAVLVRKGLTEDK